MSKRTFDYLDHFAWWRVVTWMRKRHHGLAWGVCSRWVIGWAIDEHLHTDLVQAALEMAVAMRGQLAEQVILHADRGCQYTSAQLARFAREHNLIRSVGRTAVCGQRPGRIILGHTQSRVLRQIPMAD